jgi:hypothetical protein
MGQLQAVQLAVAPTNHGKINANRHFSHFAI